MLNLERIHADTLQGLPLTMLILGGEVGQLTLNLERICEHIARITSDNVDPGSGGWGSIDSQLGKDPCKDIARITSDNVDPVGRLIDSSAWKGSMKTLQGIPLTMLIRGGGVNSHVQLGKDL